MTFLKNEAKKKKPQNECFFLQKNERIDMKKSKKE
jgi:hypothetical protein